MNQSRHKLINGPGHWLIATNITKERLIVPLEEQNIYDQIVVGGKKRKNVIKPLILILDI